MQIKLGQPLAQNFLYTIIIYILVQAIVYLPRHTEILKILKTTQYVQKNSTILKNWNT